jgi:tRNA dimethylallyltransferase
VGKTAVAHRLAVAQKMAILSVDSMLVYRGLNIGTAKPDDDMRREVPYAGIDLVDPLESFSVALYVEAARVAIRACVERRQALIVVGGTGLYFNALLHGLASAPGPDPARRSVWEERLRTAGLAALQEELQALDPAAFQALADPRNPRRLIRSLEKASAGGRPAVAPRPYRSAPILLGLRLPPAQLALRLAARVQAMYDGGLLDEVRDLMRCGLEQAPTAAQAIGYAEAMECLRGRLSRPQALELTIRRTRQYAKRQMTWFRHQAHVRWIDIDEKSTTADIAARVWTLWQDMGPVPLMGACEPAALASGER